MGWIYLSIILILVALTLAFLIWRYGSMLRSMPCPAWLIIVLENPYMKSVAGSKLLIERAELKRGMTLLDVGCGPGRISIPAADIVGESGSVTALDIQKGMLQELEKRMRQRHLENIHPIHAAAGDAALKPDTFDRAMLVTVLGEISDRIGALHKIYAALKPGGILSITEVLPDPHYQRRKVVQRLAEEAGFKKYKVYGGFLSFTINFIKEAGRDNDQA